MLSTTTIRRIIARCIKDPGILHPVQTLNIVYNQRKNTQIRHFTSTVHSCVLRSPWNSRARYGIVRIDYEHTNKQILHNTYIFIFWYIVMKSKSKQSSRALFLKLLLISLFSSCPEEDLRIAWKGIHWLTRQPSTEYKVSNKETKQT